MNPPPTPSSNPIATASPISRHLRPVIAATFTLTWLGDFLFWGRMPGVSLALYFCVMAAAIIALRWRKWSGPKVWIAAGLMLAASYATALEISFTNVAVLIALLGVIAGECWYLELPAGWARWSEPAVSWLAAPGRWIWFLGVARKTQWNAADFHVPSRDRISRAFRIFTPAVSLTIVFMVVFGYGNAIFGELLSSICTDIGLWVLAFDFSIPRFIFWIGLATFALAIAHPRTAPGKPRIWTRRLSPIRRSDMTVASLQSMAVLFVLNFLFFLVNTIDVFYLWYHAKPPMQVNFSIYVHEGVFSLTVAVLLSAAVIATIFQQEEHVRRTPFLKSLAMLWIVQNLILIAGVFLRLKLYVDAYQLTAQRFYVGCFLMLVTSGFALLAWHVARDGDINTLIFRNTLATFALFFTLQFLNVAGHVAHYNVQRWQHEPGRTLDVAYIQSLGPDAWRALGDIAFTTATRANERTQAAEILRGIAAAEKERAEYTDWRSLQIRHEHQSRWLLGRIQQLGM